MGSNLARGEIFTTSIGSVDLLYTGRIVVCKNCNILRSCQKITLLLLKSKSVRVVVPESCF